MRESQSALIDPQPKEAVRKLLSRTAAPGSLTAKDAGNARGGAGKPYREDRKEEMMKFNPKSAKTTPREAIATPERSTTRLQPSNVGQCRRRCPHSILGVVFAFLARG